MIKVQDSVPGIYYNSSRDFQLIGHLFDLVLNATKTDADLLFNLPMSTNSDDQLLDLMAYTFGLRLDKNRYTSRQLRNICSVAPQMMRAKGSVKAVHLLCTALMRADNIEGKFEVDLSTDGSELTIALTSIASCRDIIFEILPYILPAGMTFSIVQSGSINTINAEHFSLEDNVRTNKAQRPKNKVVATADLISATKQEDMVSPAILDYNTETGELSTKDALYSNLTIVHPSRFTADFANADGQPLEGQEELEDEQDN